MHVLTYGLWFQLPALPALTVTREKEVMHSVPGLWGLLSFVFEVLVMRRYYGAAECGAITYSLRWLLIFGDLSLL